MEFDLVVVWAGLIAFAVLAYVVLDGFDLGIGILSPLFRRPEDRDQAVNSIAPVWDGNETWLILGGGGLFAAFPLAYAVLLPALYVPILVMLLALVFRGVAFEFRFRSRANRNLWDLGFATGSAVAALCQGIALGALVQGIAVEGRAYAGGWWDWLTPFTLFIGVALAVGYALLGACWLILKTDGHLQGIAFVAARWLAFALVACIAGVSLWTPFLAEVYAERWFGWPAMAAVAPVPILVALLAVRLTVALSRREERAPFLAALGLFVLSYAGLAISLYPAVVPPAITIWDAAAPPESLGFLLVGSAVLLPMILGYTAWAYWVFRGKVRVGEGYHH